MLAEGVVGGFASVYGVFKVLEERGQVRRGYFVSGLGAAQFAVPGAVDRLRAARRTDELAAEPTSPVAAVGHRSGAALRGHAGWPESAGRPARIGAAVVVLPDGVPLVWHDRRSHHLVTFASALDDPRWVEALADLVHSGALRAVEIRKINGDTLAASSDAAWVRAAALAGGFADSYHGLALRQR